MARARTNFTFVKKMTGPEFIRRQVASGPAGHMHADRIRMCVAVAIIAQPYNLWLLLEMDWTKSKFNWILVLEFYWIWI